MKYIYLTILCISMNGLFAQWQDDFSDGDFTSGKIWQGDIDSFEVQNERLWLNAPANANRSYLSTESDASVDGFWEFFVEMDFNPSSTNRAFVYLISNESNLKNPLNGYYVMLGNTQDEVSLYRQNGTSSTKIIDGIDGILNTNNVKVKVRIERDNLGNWELFADTSLAFNNPISQGTVFDNTFLTSQYFGVLCQYTATRSDKFWFDDFVVTASPYVDNTPPELLQYTINDLQNVTLFFNEPLDQTTAENINNYSVSPNLQNPDSAIYNATNLSVNLSFSNALQGLTNYTFSIQNVEDLFGNALDTSFNFVVKDAYTWQSIIINEIYPDESPSFGLPLAEFVELWNISNDTLFTQGWKFSNDNSTGSFSVDTILPNEFVIICRTTFVNEYASYGKTFGVTSMPALKNAGDRLYLSDKYGTVLDSLAYFNSWYRNIRDEFGVNKKDGGYTLERIATNFPCAEFYNWYPSVATIGGTPGAENSVVTEGFEIEEIFVVEASATSENFIEVVFNAPVNPGSANQTFNYEINNGEIQVLTAIQNLEDQRIIILEVSPSLSDKQTYKLEISGLEDCFGNIIALLEANILLGLPPQIGDIVVNEILYNPFTGGSDFIEIYNRTDRAINISNVEIVRFNINNPEEITHSAKTTNSTLIIPPNAHFVFAANRENILENYLVENPEHLFQVNIPNYPNSNAIAGLILNDSIVLDKLAYRTNWHFELLDNDRGVSLERINPNAATQDKNNWKSAAKGVGSATPTYRNSQFFQSEFSNSTIWVEPQVFSPDGDGYKDFTQIFYQVNETGFVANVSIFDAVGREIKPIANNQLIPSEGQWTWDGTNKNGARAQVGIYIVLIDLFSPNGKREILKEKVVLGGKLSD